MTGGYGGWRSDSSPWKYWQRTIILQKVRRSQAARKEEGMKKYRQIMLAGLLFSVALMGCSSAAGGKQGETESKEEVSVQEQVETGTAGEAAILETDTVTAADEAGKDQTASA